MSRLRRPTPPAAPPILRETVGRVRYAGANGRLTLRADSGFYTYGVVSVCRKMDVRFSITIRQHKSLHNLSRRYPKARRFLTGWTVPPMWPRPPAPPSRPRRTPRRSIVRRVKDARFPTGPLRQIQLSRLHQRDGELLELEADHRRHARECHTRPQVRRTISPRAASAKPSRRWPTTWPAAARIGLGERIATTKTLRRRFFSLAGRTRSARRLNPASSGSLALG